MSSLSTARHYCSRRLNTIDANLLSTVCGRTRKSRGGSCYPRLFGSPGPLMLPGHCLVGFVLDLHDPAGLFVPLGSLAGLGVSELGAVSPESLNDFLLGGQFVGPLRGVLRHPLRHLLPGYCLHVSPRVPPTVPVTNDGSSDLPCKRRLFEVLPYKGGWNPSEDGTQC